ncbi:DUF6332 family protein [Streptomyces uncialis]|uniref:DUF6332 family protein n=1 Tax=Streptomyces uncialis TaxID=1048205 RepID=UPI0033CE968F
MTTERRGQAARDGATAGIRGAPVSACLLGAAAFAAIADPAAVWVLPPAVEGFLLIAGAWTAGVLVVNRIVLAMRRHAHQQHRRFLPDDRPAEYGRARQQRRT